MKKFLTIFLFSILGVGLSQATPGDAAARAGHFERAAELYRKGVEQGDVKAAMKLAFLHMNDISLPEEYKNAVYWFEKACDLGGLPACHNAGYAYEYGEHGAEKKLEKANEYYFLAAERGYMQSQYNLASLYSNNYIAPSDDVEGYKWMLLASKQAAECTDNKLCQWILDDPPGHRKRLEERMTEQQKNQARRLAISWIPKEE